MPTHYELQPKIPGGMHLRTTWDTRFALLVRAALAFFVAAVILPAPVYGGFVLFRGFQDGPHYDGQTLIAAAVLIVGASIVLIASRYGQDRLVRAIRPLEPVYDDVIPTGAAIPKASHIDAAFYAAQEARNDG